MEEEIKQYFCPHCGYEGSDLICPICNDKTESLTEEVERLREKEKEKPKDIFEGEVSLEQEQSRELRDQSDEKTEDL